jgi:hypothetical protein
LWIFHWNSRLLSPRKQKLWEEAQLRNDWEAKLARINNISLFSQPSFGFPSVDEDYTQLTRPFTIKQNLSITTSLIPTNLTNQQFKKARTKIVSGPSLVAIPEEIHQIFGSKSRMTMENFSLKRVRLCSAFTPERKRSKMMVLAICQSFNQWKTRF